MARDLQANNRKPSHLIGNLCHKKGAPTEADGLIGEGSNEQERHCEPRKDERRDIQHSLHGVSPIMFWRIPRDRPFMLRFCSLLVNRGAIDAGLNQSTRALAPCR
jgi:hypothetical protein